LQLSDRAFEVIPDERGVRTDGCQRARDYPFRLPPPRRRERALLVIPFGMIIIPVTHDLVHHTAIHTPRLPLRLLDEVAEECGGWRKRHVVDVAVEGLVHSEYESGHTVLPVLSLFGHFLIGPEALMSDKRDTVTAVPP